MAKTNKFLWIFVIILIIIFSFNVFKKQAPTGAGFGYWSAQEFNSPTNIISEIRLSIKNNVAMPNGGVDIYIATDKNVTNPNVLVYSFTHFDDSQIQGTGDFYNKTYNINDAEVTNGEKLYLVTHVLGDDDYAIMTNPNYQSGKFYHSFDGRNWINNWLDTYDIDFDVIIGGGCGADINCNGCITFQEYIPFRDAWINAQHSFSEYVNVRDKWKLGTGCFMT